MFAGIEFGILTSIIFDIRQGKRLFGLLMSGEILAGILGGVSVGALMNIMDSIDLLFISGISLILSFALLLNILKRFSKQFDDADLDEEDDDVDVSYKALLKNNYYFLFFVISLLSFFVFYFIDYIFYFQVEQHYTSEKELAGFFGIFIALLNAVNLISSVFVSGKVLSRYGVGFGLMIIPLLGIFGVSSYLFIASFSIGIAFFILITIKLLDEVFDISLLTPTFRIVYQSIPTVHRNKVLAFRETIIEPAAMGLAGVFLLGLSYLEGIEIVCFVIIFFSAVWLLLARSLKVKYVESLKSLMNKRQMLSDDTVFEDIDIEMLLEKLKSDNEIEVVYTIELLQKLEYEKFDDILISSLEHQSAMVRTKVFEIIGDLKLSSHIECLKEHLNKEQDTDTLCSIIENICKVDEVEALYAIEPFIHHENKQINHKAISSLIKYCGIDGILTASEVINKMLKDGADEAVLEVLDIINSAGVSGFYKLLYQSLGSTRPNVKKMAVETIGNLKIQKFIPELLKILEEPSTHAVTIKALSKFGVEILDELIIELEKTNSYDKRNSLLKIISLCKSKESSEYLLSIIDTPLYTDTIIEQLYESGFVTKDKKIVQELLSKNIKTILDTIVIQNNLDEVKYNNTHGAIINLNKIKIQNIFKVLSFLYPKDTINQARAKYNSSSNDMKALSIELLDNLVDNSLKQNVIPILENVSSSKKLQQYSRSVEILNYNEKEFISDTLDNKHNDLITILCVVYEIGTNKQTEYLNKLEDISKSTTNKYIQETVKNTIEQLKKD
ncbi:MAG: MFS transporter [Campylobacterota bacterium]|nr:MFS transporter [Campylobacterota bacterium]